MENQQTKRALTRSFGVNYYGEDSTENKSLSVEYLESNIKISIHRPSNNGDYRYDYKSGNEIYLREKSAKTLARILKKAVEARDNDTLDTFTPASVSSGANLIEVSSGKHHNCNTDICITIYNNIDPETKKCSNYSTFGFRHGSYVSGYNPEDGSYENLPIDTDINYFIDQLIEFSKAATGAYSHINKKDFKFDMDRIISRQLEICDKLGIRHDDVNSNRISWNNSSNSSSAGNSMISDTADILADIEKYV